MPFDPWRLVRSAWFWFCVLGIALILWLFAARFLGFGDVLCLSDRCQLEEAREGLEVERSRSAALTEQTEAREAVQQEAERSQTIIIETRTVAVEASAATHGAPDADTPLSPDLAGVLGDADRRMCMANPASCPGRTPDR
jgi:hypothetical protein